MQPLSASSSLVRVAQQYTQDILANPNTTTDVTLIMANSTPVVTCTNEVDAVLTAPGGAAADVQQLFTNGIQGNAITLAALNNAAMTSFGGFFTADPAADGSFKGTIIFGQGVRP